MRREAKKQKVETTESEINTKEEESIRNISKIQTELEKIEKESGKKRRKIELESEKLKRPFYEQRSKEIANIQEFWAQALINHDVISDIISEKDVEALKFCTDLFIQEKEEEENAFRITLKFKENPFFTNQEIWREVKVVEDGEQVSYSGVNWKPGKSLTAKQQNNAKDENKREFEEDSFFSLFESDDEALSGASVLLREELWPHALQYFVTPQALFGEEEEDDDQDDEDDDDDNEEEEN